MKIKNLRKYQYTQLGDEYYEIFLDDGSWYYRDDNGDLQSISEPTVLEGYDLDTTYSLNIDEYVYTRIAHELLTGDEELQYAKDAGLNVGIPLLSKLTKLEYDLQLKNKIRSIEGVAAIISWNSLQVDNIYSLSFSVRTISGNIIEYATELT